MEGKTRTGYISRTVFLAAAFAVVAGPSAHAAEYAYVANTFSKSVSVIDSLTGEPVTDVAAGSGPYNAAALPGGALVYVTNIHSQTVSVIETEGHSVIDTISVSNSPYDIAASPDGAYVFVTHLSTSGSLTVIDAGTNKVMLNMKVGSYPSAVTVSPDGAEAYVANLFSGSISVIDIGSMSVAAEIGVGGYPYELDTSPDGQYLYVTSYYTGEVIAVDTAARREVARAKTGSYPRGVAATGDGKYVFVANLYSRSVTVFSAPDMARLGQIAVDDFPCDLAITPDDALLYVSHYTSSGKVSIIDVAGMSLLSTVSVGGYPNGIAIASTLKGPKELQGIIDIKPESDNNTVNPRANGVLPVAVLSRSLAGGDAFNFDATLIEPASVVFGPLGAGAAHYDSHVEDVDNDGDLDMLFHFRIGQTGINCGDTEATLYGTTIDGFSFMGSDSVRTVGCRD